MQPLRPYEKEDTLKQFLQYDRRVLRFYCLWDDSDRYELNNGCKCNNYKWNEYLNACSVNSLAAF